MFLTDSKEQNPELVIQLVDEKNNAVLQTKLASTAWNFKPVTETSILLHGKRTIAHLIKAVEKLKEGYKYLQE